MLKAAKMRKRGRYLKTSMNETEESYGYGLNLKRTPALQLCEFLLQKLTRSYIQTYFKFTSVTVSDCNTAFLARMKWANAGRAAVYLFYGNASAFYMQIISRK